MELLYNCLNQENPQIQAVAVEGIAKLMLSKMIYDKAVSNFIFTNYNFGIISNLFFFDIFSIQLLKELIMLYFNVETAPNLRLRQCLSYFLPVYCHSSVENQRLMQQVFLYFKASLYIFNNVLKRYD